MIRFALYTEEKKSDSSGKATAKQLRALLEKQGKRCALSGVELSPNDSSVDHKLPLSRGGTDLIDNLQWVTRQVNKAKGTMTNEEFIQMCAHVAAKSVENPKLPYRV